MRPIPEAYKRTPKDDKLAQQKPQKKQHKCTTKHLKSVVKATWRRRA